MASTWDEPAGEQSSSWDEPAGEESSRWDDPADNHASTWDEGVAAEEENNTAAEVVGRQYGTVKVSCPRSKTLC